MSNHLNESARADAPLRTAILKAITSMAHEIDEDQIVLYRSLDEGTALSQLADAFMATMQTSPPVAPAVAWRSRMGPKQPWGTCSKEHHDWVLQDPAAWPGYEVQALAVAPGAALAFNSVASHKLDILQQRGYTVAGYAIERPIDGAQPERGFITVGGFVGWWRDENSAEPAPDAATISSYTLPVTNHRFSKELKVERSRRADGSFTWAVRCDGDCLTQQGVWEWEPQPSSRDDAFLARCRFDTADRAIAAAQRAIRAVHEAAPSGEPTAPFVPFKALQEAFEARSPTSCWCGHCDARANQGMASRMSLCPQCGDKRCPRAQHHGNVCQKGPSNGQPT